MYVNLNITVTVTVELANQVKCCTEMSGGYRRTSIMTSTSNTYLKGGGMIREMVRKAIDNMKTRIIIKEYSKVLLTRALQTCREMCVEHEVFDLKTNSPS